MMVMAMMNKKKLRLVGFNDVIEKRKTRTQAWHRFRFGDGACPTQQLLHLSLDGFDVQVVLQQLGILSPCFAQIQPIR